MARFKSNLFGNFLSNTFLLYAFLKIDYENASLNNVLNTYNILVKFQNYHLLLCTFFIYLTTDKFYYIIALKLFEME